MINQVLLSMARRVTPQMIAHDIISVQPMTSPAGQVFQMKNTSIHDRLRDVESYICQAMQAIEESWLHEFTNDKNIMNPIIWCFRELASMQDSQIGRPSAERIDVVEAKYYEMMQYIQHNYPAMMFDFEMREINTVSTKNA